MSKHTAGPWEVESGRCIVNLRSKSIVDIAGVLGSFESEEADANANLIAHAPEMYELLRVAKCPECGGTGIISEMRGYNDFTAPEQCQWCLERDEILTEIGKLRKVDE